MSKKLGSSKGSGRKNESDVDLKPDAAVAGFDGKDESLVTIRGHVGEDPEDPNSIRIYQSLTMDKYWRVAKADVLRREKLETDNAPLAGSILWVCADTEVQLREARSVTMRAEFLRGTINPSGPSAIGDFSAGNVQTTWICVTIVATTIIATNSSDITNSNCCPSNGCSATSQCLCPD